MLWTVVLEKTLESPLDCKEMQPVHPKGNQSWIFIGRTDVEAETPILWPPDGKSWLIWRLWCWKRLKARGEGDEEDEMVGWHHQLTWVWVSSGSWWWTGRPGVLQSMGSQRVGHDWATELNWTEPQSSSTNFSPEWMIRKSNQVGFEVFDLPSRLFDLYNLGSYLVGWPWRDHLIS